ncbi:hypothetical protein TNCV_854151 [Trichonephila clavipes]|nr:hypothetical protein TNCV_854151 [Trichonephila clavipes]
MERYPVKGHIEKLPKKEAIQPLITIINISKFTYLGTVDSQKRAASLKANCFGIRIQEECGEEAEQMFYKIFNGTQLYSQYCPGFAHTLARKRSEAILKTIDTLLIDEY